MKLIERLFDGVRPKFTEGGPFQRLFPLYEATETFLLSSADVTREGPHVRDALDMKRLMSIVVLALMPCFLFGAYNAGFQSLAARGLPTDLASCLLTGLKAVLPIVLTSYAVGGAWEVLFSIVRRHEVEEGFFVTGLLFPLTLPPTTPLWMVAAGISFGVVLGKEIFGGTGMNVLNPALTARAFVFFAYPAAISGDKVWTLVGASNNGLIDGYSGATPLLVAANASAPDVAGALAQAGFTLKEAVLGLIPGSIGETSALACVIGAVVLIATGIGSWRIMLSTVLGALGMVWVVGAAAGPQSSGILALPAAWHLALGGFLFGTVFMATDPATSANTRAGQWVYGALLGALCILIRTLNPAYPEGMMLAILFMNVFAPLIDYAVIRSHFRKRAAHTGAYPSGGALPGPGRTRA
ncbi:MAG: NADH:ubiquinone reductase (Na(+)-transporting) subunit B [Elusimicrobiota bacterium]